MMQQILTKFPFLHLSTIALMIFFLFFVALLVIVNTKSQKQIQKRASALPLEDGIRFEGTRHG